MNESQPTPAYRVVPLPLPRLGIALNRWLALPMIVAYLAFCVLIMLEEVGLARLGLHAESPKPLPGHPWYCLAGELLSAGLGVYWVYWLFRYGFPTFRRWDEGWTGWIEVDPAHHTIGWESAPDTVTSVSLPEEFVALRRANLSEGYLKRSRVIITQRGRILFHHKWPNADKLIALLQNLDPPRGNCSEYEGG